MKKIIIIHGAFLLVVLAGLGVACSRYWNVAVVNGIGISRIDYIKTLEQQGGKQVLSVMIDDALILKEGKVKNVTIDQKIIDEEIAKLESRLKQQNQNLDSALAAAGMTKDQLIQQIKMKKIQDTLSAPKTEITQTQIDEFLKTNKALLPTGKTKDELNTLAKQELTAEASKSAATNWLDELRKNAKIIYK